MRMCPCVDPDLFECLSQRHQAGLSLARIMAGCNCRCHHTESGARAITHEEWQKNRERMARPERPSLSVQRGIRDPRIRALMQEDEEEPKS